MQVVDDPLMAEEQARAESFAAEEAQWGEKKLEPYTSGREGLFSQLRLAAGALPLGRVVDDMDAFFPDAVRILYLCSHTPEEWRGLRGDLLVWQEKIEEWGNEHVPLAKKSEAVTLAMNILATAYVGEHVPVSRHGKTPSAKK